MIKFHKYDSSLHRTEFVKMNISYLNWIRDVYLKKFGLDMLDVVGSIADYVQNSLPMLESLVPPQSIIYLVLFDDVIVGMGGLRKLTEDIVEVKRMYVKPEFRGKGLGKSLLEKLLETAKNWGYSKIRLDTGVFMEAAQKVYRSAGFYDIEEYPETEVPKEVRHNWIYMEKIL
ncbi:MAG: GNAT family N-acetyltransferase [Candidatus Heimdallarchaeaceae archaeon]